MTPSLSIALPSIHRLTTTTGNQKSYCKSSNNYKNTTSSTIGIQKSSSTAFKQPRNHVRTTSVPSALPSYLASKKKQQHKLSMDILLDAIDLDQEMRQFFKTEVVKSKSRNTSPTPFHPSMMMARRRSKSAPGAPPSYHYQQAFNTRWYTQDQQTITSASEAQQVANLLVQQHIQAAVKQRGH